jgi:hypothetical protein
MSGKCSVSARVAIVTAALLVLCLTVSSAQAYRICTFKGTVLDNGWRSMTVKSNGQCAEVNVGWRTKYIPNRRPCVGEQVAVDFLLEDGYMKATKVVSLSPLPSPVQCYPPPPPSSSVCRTVGGEEPKVAADACAPSRPICSTRPPAHVADPSWSPGRGEPAAKPAKPEAKKPPIEKKKIAKAPAEKPPAEAKETPKEGAPKEEGGYKQLTGDVVASTPKALSVRVMEGETADVINIKVGLKTKFIPFRRPSVAEKVRVKYREESGDKFGYEVQVVQ